MKGPLPLPTSIASGSPLSNPFLMPSHINPFLHGGAQLCTVTLPPLYHKSGSSAYFGMDSFDPLPPALDSLDSLNIGDYKNGTLRCVHQHVQRSAQKCVTDFFSRFRFRSESVPSAGNSPSFNESRLFPPIGS